jgi:CcmD family protein
MAGIRQRIWAALLAAVLLGTGAVPGVGAQEPGQSEFRTISPDEAALERLPATPFVFWAYAIVWIVLILYVFSLWRRLGRVEQEMQALSARLGQRP